jgi:hypothetical protein
MDPFEKYEMIFNRAIATRMPPTSPGRWAGQDNAWVMSLIQPVIINFNKSIINYPSIRRIPRGHRPVAESSASGKPCALLDPNKPP